MLAAFRSLFVSRADCHALQLEKGGYVKVEKPLTNEVLTRHLKGDITVGAYQLNSESHVKWLTFDLDPEKLSDPKEVAKRILAVCFEKRKEEDGVERPRVWQQGVLLEASRYPDPSYHVWLLFSLPVHAKVARWLGLRILELANLSPKQVELFPKQSELDGLRSYGNLVKLPLGFHRVEKKWSRFLDPQTFEPLPNEVLLDCWGLSFSEADLAKIMSFEEKKNVQLKLCLPKNFKPLKNREENRVAFFLAKYWQPGQRNRVELAFLGWAIKKGISFESAYRIIEQVVRLTNDEERAQRLQLVKYHYQNRRSLGAKLLGISGLREIVKEALNERLERT